jgi:hypothetical protein
VLQCTYEEEVDPKYFTLQPCTLQQACKGVGISSSRSIMLDLEAETRQALSSMRCDKATEAVQVVKLMDPTTPQQIQMSKEQGRNCFVPTAAQAFRRGQAVGCFSGILQEKVCARWYCLLQFQCTGYMHITLHWCTSESYH